jgi:lipoprotein-anchoring transpeptidase ErfK/SrfK
MVGRLLGLAVFVAATSVGSLALAQVYAPPPPPPGYPSYPTTSTAPGAYPPAYRAPAPNVDVLEDDDTMPQGAVPPATNQANALPPPGPILSPDDPRYARGLPPSAPMPQGPVVSPYGQPTPPPAVIYSDRTVGPQDAQPPYDANAVRPPQGIGEQQQAAINPGAQPPAGAEGRNSVMSILPPEDQPETGAPVQLPPNLRRQEVSFVTKEPPGTIVVDTPNTYLYYVLGNNRAIRYGVRVGREGFTWAGVQKVTRKAEWPDWHPPPEMIERQPYLPRFMAGGDGNPLGARAMYLGSTSYRIHGTNQPSTIGKFVSSGCVGMLNEDVSDLFERVKVGTRVVVLPNTQPVQASAAPPPQPGYPPQASALPPQGGPLVPAAPMYRGDSRTDATSVQPLPPPTNIR